MGACSKCGRPLLTGETALCPACKAAKHETGGKWLKALATIATVVGGVVITVVTRGKVRPKGR